MTKSVDDPSIYEPQRSFFSKLCCCRIRSRFDSINDSIRVGLRRSQKSSGGMGNSYKPRAPFPLPSKQDETTEISIAPPDVLRVVPVIEVEEED
mmetsp:Transcript_11370/g.22517  ORF Transcript_11370/g.22517 Transcript_11370/m.22517 type:complete len:94 (+) Transcript_11370:153-434(+)|eukprot:CAMPEP_0194324596 /NCGR_PEP_ID=MMETSP0171-20130528/28692_1 /TAXON_ID=218684 /ORGANISM="Corethron pennatum, Strain L29A3" /LENGTH=93 /DNA_ID=CAMNT_0039083535 /DNA_START=147 /DNA_END=428 /DNA_ORIENTATION=-